MTADPITLAWVAAGVLLMLSEFIIPGMVVLFLGAGALVVATARVLGVVDSWMGCFLLWFCSSLGLILTFRGVLQRFVSGDADFQSTDEDADAFGQIVEVVQPVTTRGEKGRIRFRGSTWPARCLTQELPAGSRARIVGRDNLVWLIEPKNY